MKNSIITYLRGFLRAHSKSCRFSLILDIVVLISLLTTLSGVASATDYNLPTSGDLPPPPLLAPTAQPASAIA